jgi:lipopolysaccharide biosynthesis protein
MSTLDIVEVPSRGRDVAPWLVTFGARLSAYGLACHIHTKTSAHFDFGDTWREYLFDNLIDPEAARDIIQHMARDGRLGIVFPPLFGPLAQFMTRRRIPTLGLENESRLCDALCKKINLPITARRHNTLFSAGTMFWYRPAALEPLIQAGLTYDDFPPEPIGVGGTLAHAIERLPALVAESQGYQTRCYLRQSELLDNSWEQSRSEALATPKRSLEEWPGFGVAYTVFSRLFPTGSRRHAVAKRLALRAVRLLRAD